MNAIEFPVIEPILVRHADDAAFYWSQLESASRSFHWRFDDQIRTENLLAAHLDGLAIAGQPGFDKCVFMFDRWKKGGNLFTCVYLASTLGLSEQLDTLVERVQKQPDGLVRGLISALLHLPSEQAVDLVAVWSVPTAKPVQKVAALRAITLGGSGLRAALAADVTTYLNDVDPHTRAAACRAASVFEDDSAVLEMLAKSLSDPVRQVRAEASIACLRTGLRAHAIPVLQACLRDQSSEYNEASGWFRQQASRRLERWAKFLAHALPVGAPELPELLNTLPARIALTVILAHGDPGYLPYIVEQMRDPSVSRYAAWVWQAMTGVSLVRMGFTLQDEDSDALAPSGPVTQARLDADSGLVAPNHAAIAAYMATQPFTASLGSRMLLGKQRDLCNALTLFKEAPQCIRAVAAHTLQQSQGRLLVNVRAKSTEQELAMDVLEHIIAGGVAS